MLAVAKRHSLTLIEDSPRRTGRPATSSELEAPGSRQRSASTPPRTSGRWATLAPGDRRRRPRRARARCGSTGSGASTCTTRGLHGTPRHDPGQFSCSTTKPHLDRWNDERRRVAASYALGLEGVGTYVFQRCPTGPRRYGIPTSPGRSSPSAWLISCERAESGPGGTTRLPALEPRLLGARVPRGRSPSPRRCRASVCPFRSSPVCLAGQAEVRCRRACTSTSRVGNEPINDAPYRIMREVELGERVRVGSFVNLYECRGRRHGDRPIRGDPEDAGSASRCKIQSHTFVCSGVDIATRCSSGTA